MSRVTLILALALSWSGLAAAADKPALRLTNPFFAFDNGVGQGKLTAAEQAQTLAELGYAGMGSRGVAGFAEMFQAFDARKVKVFSTYVSASVDPQKPKYDPGLPEAIKLFQGRDVILWLTIVGAKASTDTHDERAVAIVREIAELAQAAGLRVALYPHAGFYVARVPDALRICQKVDRPNVGVSFNLCHWLKEGELPKLEERLRETLPHLFVVSINGADREGDWSRLIQTLDRGEFDVYGFLVLLRKLGYDGPIGLQCYALKGDMRENLTRSIGAWRKFVARMEAENP